MGPIGMAQSPAKGFSSQDRFAQRNGKVGDRGIDADHQVEGANQGGGGLVP